MEEHTMTSETHPIYADFIPSDETVLPGLLGMTFAPGMKTQGKYGYWDRDLETDLRVLKNDYCTDTLVSVMEEFEYDDYGIPELFEQDLIEGIEVLHFAIEDMNIPQEARMADYETRIQDIIDCMSQGKNVVVHCRGGLGRTGTVAACVLVALGRHTCKHAIDTVRKARKGTVQTPEQEWFVCHFEEILRKREEDKS